MVFGVGPAITYSGDYHTGNYIIWRSGTRTNNDLFITLPSYVTAFGIDYGMYYGEVAPFDITLSSGDIFDLITSNLTTVDTFNLTTALNAYSFFGVTTDTAFNTITISALEIPTIDNLSQANAVVPIPATLPLFGSALGLMGFIGWKRRKAA